MSKIYYLDTNTCIFYMRRQYEKLCSKVDSLIECIKLPAIVKAELLVGAFKSADPKQVLKDSLAFCEPFEIVPFDDTMTEIYGKIKAS
ncbi:MAG: type II toxin-antitoxin system VapC family toxin, partial [Synergistaceae bacterium]|nr:type II toxin-antitoxin system VapC family toxin [Synergistaceae bacterium]